MEEEKHTISLELSFDGIKLDRKEESILAANSALFRPLRQLAEEGKPIGTINYIFYKEKVAHYVLGSLCYSPGGRVLFYPGIRDRVVRWVTKQGESPPVSVKDILIDHLTLDGNLKRGHITARTINDKSKIPKKVSNFATKKITDDAIFWFAMSIKNASILERMVKRATLSFTSLASDTDRRADEVIKAREGAIFHIVRLAKDVGITTGEFLHFRFFLGGDDYKSFKHFWALPKPHIQGLVYERHIPIRTHPMSIVNLPYKVWVLVSKHGGELSNDAIFTT